MKLSTLFRLAVALTCFAVSRPGLAQTAGPETHCLLLPLDPVERTRASALIVEAEVLDARSFWDAGHRRIYTAHRLRVFKSFKGAPAATLTLITEGGTVDLDRHELTNTLTLQPGEQGVLFLYPAPFADLGLSDAWAAYGSQQGFIRYDLTQASAAEPFRQYPLLGLTFYTELTAATGQPLRELQPNPALQAAVSRRSQPPADRRGGQAPIIATVAPATITAGTDAVLTINGSGFGATRGNGFVEFRNADDGGATFIRPQDAEYVSWTDTRIQVRVPTLSTSRNPAGSGVVRVTSNEQLQAISPGQITVVYAIINVQDTQSQQIVRPGHFNQNGMGGYSFRPEANLTAAAAASFQRALTTWRCQTGVNWDLGAARSGRGPAEDDENALGFDMANELPARVLGRTTNYYRGCRLQPSGRVVFWVKEIDMQFDDATNWQFGPGLPVVGQYDFETVAVHELGHAQQLTHLILRGAVMHFAIDVLQVTRQLNPQSDVAGGRFLLRNRSFVPPGCGPAPMLPAPLTTVNARSVAGAGTEVTWTTQSECFVQSFVVERAPATDTTSWQQLSVVSAGAAGGTYRFVDAQPPGGLLYYRLRVRRPDGSLDNVAPQAVTAAGGVLTQLQVFPNPVADENLMLQFDGGIKAGQVTVFLYDALGRYQRGIQLDYNSGINILTLNVGGLHAGWHLLRWRDSEGKTGYTPFIKVAR
ncbi:matrixin family metalloprotease [Hymenobacter sp. BT175]|uniref:matrixin family metalloprotease n=1 Tax=Hymenobacter translucens TaxID=2886507 RepID=UPI001D0E79F1|nr:matrixin family metalloprotease [Hymenobacter translucens]MCC2545979.1 matrixin family metalloprotease [Hymenobacter translucens]